MVGIIQELITIQVLLAQVAVEVLQNVHTAIQVRIAMKKIVQIVVVERLRIIVAMDI